jgi:hypothetical protein
MYRKTLIEQQTEMHVRFSINTAQSLHALQHIASRTWRAAVALSMLFHSSLTLCVLFPAAMCLASCFFPFLQEFKRKFHFLSTQVRQSKSEIEDKNQLIVFEHFNLQNVRDDIGALESQNSLTHQNLDKADELLRTQTAQIRKLSTIIADADEELRVQIKQYNSIVNEQRVLNQQLVKRNDELAALYEQLKLQNSILTKSAAHYKEKQLLLAEYEHEYALVSKTLQEVLGDIGKFVELKDTIASLEHSLVAEQLKVKALEDELRKPINIHRWRRLMDTNTDTYGMIKKVRGLQKDIIAKTEAVATKDAAIQEKEKLYVELRRVLARQPGSEAAEQLRVYLEQLDEKRSKLKAMKSELKLYQAKVKEHQYELTRIDSDMQLLKLEYFRKRKAMQRKHGQQQQGGGGGNGGGAGGGGGLSSGEFDDMPDILRPTEFPNFPPHPGFGGGDATAVSQDGLGGGDPASYNSTLRAPGDSATRGFSSDGLNPYMASASASAAASARHRPGSSGVRGLDESDDEDHHGGEDDSGADDDVDRDFRDEEREEALRRLEDQQQQQQQSSMHEQKESTPASAQASARELLQSSSRQSLRSASRQSLGRPDSRSGGGGAGVAPLQASAFASAAAAASSQSNSVGQLSHRSDSRNSQRGGGGGQLSQRGDAGFSRFPTIGATQ